MRPWLCHSRVRLEINVAFILEYEEFLILWYKLPLLPTEFTVRNSVATEIPVEQYF